MNNSSVYQILVVDDREDNVALLQCFLNSAGYAVETATDGFSALQQVLRSPPDLVLLDVMMPGMDGLEVTRQLRRNNGSPSIPIVLVTAAQEIGLQQALSVGANDYISKPIDLDQLLETVRAWCG